MYIVILENKYSIFRHTNESNLLDISCGHASAGLSATSQDISVMNLIWFSACHIILLNSFGCATLCRHEFFIWEIRHSFTLVTCLNETWRPQMTI